MLSERANEQNLATAQDPRHDGPGGSGVANSDKFGMVLRYQNMLYHIGDPQYQNATPRWNGNISWAMYTMSGVNVTPGTPYSPTALVGNTYSYDKAGRILGSNFGFYSQNTGNGVWGWYGTNMYDESGYQYDASGNITAVQRYGSTGALMDNLGYVYGAGTNRLRHISDAVAAGTFASDIDNQVTDNYAYDANGSMEKDLQRDVAFVVNDIHNLPVSMWKASTGQELRYYYDTEGKRIRKDVGSTEYYVNGPGGETEVVVKSDASGATHNILGRDNLGQVKRSGTAFARYYYLKDHLGTIKMTVDGSCNVVGYDDYYPFGQQMDLRCGATVADGRLKYTSKERDAESGYDCFGARYYDARAGRWVAVDPLEESYPGLSAYAYVSNGPITRIDQDGRAWNWLVGGALGAGLELLDQTITRYQQGMTITEALANTNWSRVAIAGMAGAASSGLSALRAAQRVKLAGQALLAAVESGAKQAAGGQRIDPAKVGADVIIGTFAQYFGDVAQEGIKQTEGAFAKRAADRTANIARKDPTSMARAERAKAAQTAYDNIGASRGDMHEAAVVAGVNVVGAMNGEGSRTNTTQQSMCPPDATRTRLPDPK